MVGKSSDEKTNKESNEVVIHSLPRVPSVTRPAMKPTTVRALDDSTIQANTCAIS